MTLSELEARMRPGSWSHGGFLGPAESLEAVIGRDDRTLEALGVSHELSLSWGSFDFLMLNRESGEYFTGSGLIVHLIRAHHFFEGVESPYRMDPARAVRVLGLARSRA